MLYAASLKKPLINTLYNMSQVLHLTAGELRQLRDRIPGHFQPEHKLTIVANEKGIKLLDPIIEEGKPEPNHGLVKCYLQR